MSTSSQIWNDRYKKAPSRGGAASDHWLDKWKHSLAGAKDRALDIGCGFGDDSKFLSDCGCRVTALDFSDEAIAKCKATYPDIDFRVTDLLQGLDFPDNSFDVIVASLSLHYFERSETIRIVNDIVRVLKRGGLFIFRVNAAGDYNSGYRDNTESWETIIVDGVRKQFFRKEMIEEILLDICCIEALEISETHRYGRKKTTWNCLARKIQ